MIERLVIRGLGVIDEATIDFAPGLTAITGETGAGKTMVLTGFALLGGAKAEAALVRTGAAHASVDGEWVVAADDPLVERLRDAGADLDDLGASARVLLARTVAEGRSRAFAGGRSVPAAVLGEAADALVTVHGQSEQLRLRSPERQREIVDRFGGCANALREYREAFTRWRSATGELAELLASRAERDREATLLAHGIAEIEALDPRAGEDVELDRQAAVLANSGSLLADVAAAHDALVGGEDGAGHHAVGALAAALQSLERAARLDSGLESQVAQVRELLNAVPDLAGDLAGYLADVDADPSRQAWVEDRRAELAALKRRYGQTIDDVLGWLQAARATVNEVSGDDDRVQALQAAVADLVTEVCERAKALTALRVEAAARLADAVTAELNELAMPDAVVEIRVTSVAGIDDFSSSGADEIEIQLRPHVGAPFRPITRGASGGELSRVMLGLEVALAGADPVPTFVFDEVDAGIGGRAAVEVGRRLARLAATSQVIVVTHLPQVAAFADRHIAVFKAADGSVTSSSTRVLEGRARVDELVRMLSGLDATEAGAAHAEELLAVAAAERGSGDGQAPRVTKGRSVRR